MTLGGAGGGRACIGAGKLGGQAFQFCFIFLSFLSLTERLLWYGFKLFHFCRLKMSILFISTPVPSSFSSRSFSLSSSSTSWSSLLADTECDLYRAKFNNCLPLPHRHAQPQHGEPGGHVHEELGRLYEKLDHVYEELDLGHVYEELGHDHEELDHVHEELDHVRKDLTMVMLIMIWCRVGIALNK